MKHYIELDWPRLTDHQVSEIIRYYNLNGQFPIPQLEDRTNNAILLDPQTPEGRKEKYRFFNGIFPYRRIDKFQNYPVNWTLASMNVVKIPSGNLEPHTDIARKIGLYYVIQGSADSVWYEYPDGTIPVAGKSYIKEVKEGTVVEVERVRFKPHTWYIYDFAAVHSVENATPGERIGFGVGLPQGVFKSFQDLVNHPERDIRLTHIKHSFLEVSHNLQSLSTIESGEIVYDLPYDPGNDYWKGGVESYTTSDGSTAYKFKK
jgi:hypothetical protein